jgi:hypothetical protein
MTTATAVQPVRTHQVLTRPTFTLADRLKIQQESCRDKRYFVVGRLTSLVFEAQRDTRGLSASRARWANSDQAKHTPDAMAPFSEKQCVLWASISLDWLTHKNAPVIAVSADRKDLLLPNGLTPLPDIPDPRWTPAHAMQACPRSKHGCSECVTPRIPQLLTGCPVVGDRVTDKITSRSGRVLGVIHPVLELCVMLAGVQGGFGRVRGGVDPADGSHLALVIDDSNPHQLQANFVGGRFQLGN